MFDMFRSTSYTCFDVPSPVWVSRQNRMVESGFVQEYEMLKEGDRAPTFTLPADDGTEVSLSDYQGRHVVLFFYPKASTPG